MHKEEFALKGAISMLIKKGFPGDGNKFSSLISQLYGLTLFKFVYRFSIV
ncbi:MAG: hypothetical protein DF168_01727 [Candidatus Moanabacter tarae]|uniref:Uncharacterized protein n=1 Tax=Candidatus Moanibacter tarae TaxID=2200854 RepID=A0A2Z4ADZ3_9BACT|nr:MAG: hypothetical protein DF168_01727 [Candidatus Moanabacter tarae]